MKIKGAIFDVDGTLLDSMHVWRNAGPLYLESLGIVPHEDITKSSGAKTLLEAAEYLRLRYNINKTAERIVSEINASIEDAYYNRVQLKENTCELLMNLKENGIKLTIATLTDKYLVTAALLRLGIIDIFDNIFSCGDMGVGKDKPDIYIKAAQSMGTSPFESVVFEDALYAMQTAKNAGFRVVAVYDKWARHTREEIEKTLYLQQMH